MAYSDGTGAPVGPEPGAAPDPAVNRHLSLGVRHCLSQTFSWETMALVITSPLAEKECNRLLPPLFSDIMALQQREV